MSTPAVALVFATRSPKSEANWWDLATQKPIATISTLHLDPGGRLVIRPGCPADTAREAFEAYLRVRDGVWPDPTHTILFKAYGEKEFHPIDLLDPSLTEEAGGGKVPHDGADGMLDFDVETSR